MKLRLMADYQCHPLWEKLESGVRNVSPAELPISDALKHALVAWAASYDSTLNQDDPAQSGFPSEREERGFEATGLRLWAALRAELGPTVDVSYFSQESRCELDSPRLALS